MMPEVRKPKFDLTGCKKHWFNDNAFLTHILNSMHVVFPEGEKFFIRSAKAYMNEVEGAHMKKRIKAFIAQEVQHMQQHEQVWDVLRDQGLAIDTFQKVYTKTAYGFFEKVMNKLFTAKISLSTTAALEHYTATLAELAFEDIWHNSPVEMKELLQWHAIEEIEHKSVVFDELQEVSSSYALRLMGFVLGSLLLVGYTALGATILMWSDKDFHFWQLPREIYRTVKTVSGGESGFFGKLFQYLKPGFHPDHIENEHLIGEFLENAEVFPKAV